MYAVRISHPEFDWRQTPVKMFMGSVTEMRKFCEGLAKTENKKIRANKVFNGDCPVSMLGNGIYFEKP